MIIVRSSVWWQSGVAVTIGLLWQALILARSQEVT